MDPGTILAVVSISGTVIGKIWKYYSDVEDAKEEIERLRLEVEGTRKIIQQLVELVQSAPAGRLNTLPSLDGSIKQTRLDLERLDKKLEPGKRHRFMSKVNFKVLTWPLKKEETHDCISRLQRFKSTVAVALGVDQT